MAKAKYKQYVELMFKNHQEDFKRFKSIHDKYGLHPDELQEDFNEKGRKIVNIINMWEDKLCRQSEKGGYGNYTISLAEKFRNEIRKNFPHIDSVGITKKKSFSLKKIDIPV